MSQQPLRQITTSILSPFEPNRTRTPRTTLAQQRRVSKLEPRPPTTAKADTMRFEDCEPEP